MATNAAAVERRASGAPLADPAKEGVAGLPLEPRESRHALKTAARGRLIGCRLGQERRP